MNIQEMHEGISAVHIFHLKIITNSRSLTCTTNETLSVRHTQTSHSKRAASLWFRHGGGRAEGKGMQPVLFESV